VAGKLRKQYYMFQLGDLRQIASSVSNVSSQIPKIISSVNTTQRLLALALLLNAVFLGFIATRGLDAAGYKFLVSVGSFVSLVIVVLAFTRDILVPLLGNKNLKNRDLKIVTEKTRPYDVFLAAPMASEKDNNVREQRRNSVIKIITEIEESCNIPRNKVFYAGSQFSKDKEFEEGHRALVKNLSILKDCSHFILVYPERIQKPSSIFVEVGLAIALGKKNIWFVRSQDDLPYILRGAANANDRDEFSIKIYDKKDNTDKIIKVVRDAGINFLT
jgi:hypothetical protein